MKIDSIEIHGIHNIEDIKLGLEQIVYITGTNGSGKSTILQSIQWAILGYIPGTPKRKSDIFQHASGPSMEAKVVFSDESYIRRQLIQVGSQIEEVVDTSEGLDPATLVEELELPIWNFGEFTNMTANKLKDWFIQHLPNPSIDLDWKKALEDACPETIKDMHSDIVEQAIQKLFTAKGISEGEVSTSIEDIQAVNAFCKEQLKYEKENLDMLSSTVKTMVQVDPPDIQMSEDEISAKISELLKQQQDVMQYAVIESQNQTIQSTIDELAEELTGADKLIATHTDSIEKKQQELKQCEDAMTTNSQLITSLDLKIREASTILSSKGICPYTQKKCAEISAAVKDQQESIDKYTDQITTLKTSQTALHLTQTQLKQEIMELQVSINDITEKQNRYTQLQGQIISQSKLDLPSADEITAEIDRYQQLKSQITAYKYYENEIYTFTSKKVELAAMIDMWKAWAKYTDVNNLQEELLSQKSPFEELISYMNKKYIQIIFGEDAKILFQSVQDKANSFSFGIQRGSIYVPYDRLSSGEKCVFAVALLTALLESSSIPLKTILLDDIFDHLDLGRLEAISKIISQTNLQLIIASVVPIPKYDNVQDIHMMNGFI